MDNNEQNKIKEVCKFGLLGLYNQQDVFFTGGPNYTLFSNEKNVYDDNINKIISKNINKNFSKKYKHTHFHIDTDKIILDEENKEIPRKFDLITDMILETKSIPEYIELTYMDNIYKISISENNIIHQNESTYYIKIPFINFRFLIIFLTNTFIKVMPNNNNNNDKFNILHYRYVYLDTSEKRNLAYNKYKYIIDNNIFDIIEKQEFFLENSIETNNGKHIIRNCILWDVNLETNAIPEFIIIKFGQIKETITKSELEFYNNIYNDTITKFDDKYLIKIPMFFNTDIILYDTLELQIATSEIKSKLSYKYRNIQQNLIDTINYVSYMYRIVKYFKHKNIEIINNQISLDEFYFPLKELWFDIPINEYIYLYIPSIGHMKYEKNHLQILNHLFGFGKIVNSYNLISLCVDNKTDYTGYRRLIHDSDIYIPNGVNNIAYCDVYGIGYKIIKYCFNEANHFDCMYAWND